MLPLGQGLNYRTVKIKSDEMHNEMLQLSPLMGPITGCYCLSNSWEPLIRIFKNYDQQILFTPEMKSEEQNACGGRITTSYLFIAPSLLHGKLQGC